MKFYRDWEFLFSQKNNQNRLKYNFKSKQMKLSEIWRKIEGNHTMTIHLSKQQLNDDVSGCKEMCLFNTVQACISSIKIYFKDNHLL